MEFRSGISRRIATGYLIILLIAVLASVVSILTLQNNRQQYIEIEKVYLPITGYVKDFRNLSKESDNLATDWIWI